MKYKKQKVKKKTGVIGWLLNIAIVVCAGVLVYALYNLYIGQKEYQVAEREYEVIAEDFEEVLDREELAEDPEGFGRNEDIRALLEKYAALNEDFLGIIYIPGTNIFYPLVQGTDNDWYLTHTFDGTYNSSGSIFLDYGAAPDFSHPNTIIYGHNMHNGTMFENLNLLLDDATLAQYHTVYILTLAEVRVYDIFWAGQVTVEHDLYTTWFENDEEIVDYFAARAPGRGLGAKDTVLTLSTCTYEIESINRVVAQAVLEDVIALDEFDAGANEAELNEELDSAGEVLGGGEDSSQAAPEA